MAASPSGSRPVLRTAGVALLGIGVVAATVGLFTSVTGGNGAGTAVPSSSQALAPTEASAAPATPAPPPPTEVAPPPQSVPAAPGATAPAAQSPAIAAPAPAPAPAPHRRLPRRQGSAAGAVAGGGAGAAVRPPLRVYNNSLVQGLAATAKADFEAGGWTVTESSNYSGGNIPHSTAYFRPGTAEESAAHELGREFGLQVEPRFPGIQQSSDGVIVIVTEDFKTAGRS